MGRRPQKVKARTRSSRAMMPSAAGLPPAPRPLVPFLPPPPHATRSATKDALLPADTEDKDVTAIASRCGAAELRDDTTGLPRPSKTKRTTFSHRLIGLALAPLDRKLPGKRTASPAAMNCPDMQSIFCSQKHGAASRIEMNPIFETCVPKADKRWPCPAPQAAPCRIFPGAIRFRYRYLVCILTPRP